MKTSFTFNGIVSVLFSKISKRAFILFVAMTVAANSYAHRIETYTTSGCFPGQAVTVDAIVVAAGSNTMYQWQFRDASGNWRCFTNGTNATIINGVAFTVSGATGGPVANDAPLLTISRADGNTSVLDNVLVRVIMRDIPGPVCDNTTPIGHTITGDTYGGDDQALAETKYLRLHIYNRVGDCGGNTPGCIGNMLTTAGGIYYGGFENKFYVAALDFYNEQNFIAGNGSSDLTAVVETIPWTSSANSQAGVASRYQVLNDPYFMNNGFARNIAPHTGNFQMVIQGAVNAASRAWYKTITVVPGSVYKFSAWAARVNGTDPNLALNVTAGAATTELNNADLSSVAIGNWVEITGTYTIPAGVTSITINITDKNGATGSNAFTLDGLCFRLLGSIGDKVWNDINKNGVQDASEVGVAGIVVGLFDANNVNIASTTTDALGNYLFSGLDVSDAGTNYQLRFSLPAEYKFSPQNSDGTGVTGANNSDANIATGRTGNITLTTAAPNVNYADAGVYYATPNRIGDFVWNDLNKNGIQDAGEPGIAGVTVMLYNSANVLIATTISSNNGNYYFNDVPAGSYYIKVSPPIGYQFSAKDATTDGSDSDFDPTTRKTDVFTVTTGTFDLSFDAGLNVTPTTGASASLGDRVWNDLNGNNLQDAGEPGVADVTVQLFNAANVSQGIITTDAFGYYMFNGLTAGTYYVKFTLPVGFNFVSANSGTNEDIDSDVDATHGTGTTGNVGLAADQVKTFVDAGIKLSTATAAIGDLVWYDLDKDGIQDAGAEVGVPGITVNLYNASNVLVQTITTDKNGFYLFTGLPVATSYTVGFTNIPAGYTFGPLAGAITVTNNSDADPTTGRTSTVTTGAVNTTVNYVDAGLIITPNTFDSKGSIGDKVWNDLNNNGIQDANEPGVKDVVVTLYGADGTTVIATTTTDALGKYIFTNLDAGSYIAGFSNLPAGYVFATPNATGSNSTNDSDPATGTGKTNPITLMAGEVNLTIDAGVRNSNTSLLTIGDLVWYDLNGNGLQDVGEPGAQGVSVALLDVNSNMIKTTTTNAAGSFLFTDLNAGTYSIQFGNLPAGYIATTKGVAGTAINSDGNTASLRTDAITLAATDLTWDLGIRSVTKAAIGDLVWSDTNANGMQDAGEPGVAGVTVTLYNAAGVAVASTVTDAKGFYFFPNVDPGTYTIGFTTIPANSGFTTKDATGDAADSDVDPSTGRTDAFTVVAGEINTTKDAGLVTLLAAVGNYVWRDANVNGKQDANEKGVGGVTVTLFTSTDGIVGNADDVAVASAVTDENGYYFINNIPVAAGGSQFYIRFNDLQANNVFTAFNASGSTGANNSDVTSAPATNGRTGFFTLSPGQINLDIDAGLVGPDNFTLPLHRLELTANLNGTAVGLKWLTETEINTDKFIIQRSIDGVNYINIGTKAASGQTVSVTNYQSADDIQSLLSNAVIYYRIKVMDIDGKFTYSNIVPVRLSKLAGAFVWPNPFVSDIRINYTAAANTTLEVRMTDNAGRTVMQSYYPVGRGSNQLSISNVEKFAPGIYLIQITDKNTGQSFVQKMTK